MRDIVEKYQHYMAEAARLQNLAEEQAAYIAELETALIELAEEGKVNPWAVCSAKVGRGDKAKYERCVMDIKASGRADLGEAKSNIPIVYSDDKSLPPLVPGASPRPHTGEFSKDPNYAPPGWTPKQYQDFQAAANREEGERSAAADRRLAEKEKLSQQQKSRLGKIWRKLTR